MQVYREVGSGVTVPDVRRVVAATVGVGAVARRLGVTHYTAHRWARSPASRSERCPRRRGCRIASA